MQWTTLAGLLPFFISSVLALVLAISYRALKKRRDRLSPLASKQIGHVPGQQLMTKVADHEFDMMSGVMLMYMALPLMFMTWAGARIDWSAVRWGFHEWLFLVGGLALFGYGLREYISNLHARDRVRDGLVAERVTGMQLNRLIAQGCTVIHDLPCEGFNIDHVVIAPKGVFAVETKSFRKPKGRAKGEPAKVMFDGTSLAFSDFSTRKPLEQSRQQAQWLARYLREALGEAVRVDPAVSVPGWYVEKSEAAKMADVFVFTPMGRGYEWFAYGEAILPVAKRALIAQALATRFPALP